MLFVLLTKHNNNNNKTMMNYSDISREEIGLIEQTMMDFIRENFDFCEEEVKKVEDATDWIEDNFTFRTQKNNIIYDVLEEIFEDDLFVNYLTEHAGVSEDDLEELSDYYSIGEMVVLYKALKREKMVALLPGLLGHRVDANIATIIYDFCR